MNGNGKFLRAFVMVLTVMLCVCLLGASASAAEVMRGDVNEDGRVNAHDSVYLLRHTLYPTKFPLNQSGDMDKSGVVNANDAIYLLRHSLFPEYFPLEEEEKYTEGVIYEISADGTYATVTGYEGTDTDVRIAKTYEGVPVTGIGDLAFNNCSSVTSLTIPGSVTSIGNRAFQYCGRLASMVIPDSVTSIGNYTFYGCSSLESVTIPKSVTRIGDYVFGDCSKLTDVIIPNTVTHIGNGVFVWCESLTSVTIPESVTSIGIAVFSHCTGLVAITVDEDNSVYYSENNCIIEKESKKLVSGCVSSVIPDDVKSIGGSAFSGYLNLTSVIIPDSVVSIDKSAFDDCIALMCVTIGKNVITIGDSAFWGCTSLESVTVPESVTSIGYLAFYYCTSLESVTILSETVEIYDHSYTISDTATIYGYKGSTAEAYAIKYGRNFVALEEEKYTEGVIYEISADGTYATVTGYEGTVTDVRIADTYKGVPVTGIGESAFEHCNSFTSVTIPTSVMSIGRFAFYSCSALTNVTIPDGVTSIGVRAFAYCEKLVSLTVDADNGVYYSENNCIIEKASKTLVVGCKNSVIPKNVTKIGDFAFEGCSALMSVIIPEEVTSVGRSAFYYCKRLASMIIPKGVTSIGEGAFGWCDNLASITVEEDNSVYYSENNCIIEKASKTLVVGCKNSVIPNDVACIGDHAFYYCTALTSMTIPESVTTIGGYAFFNCAALASVTIPASVTCIGDFAFYGCRDLQSVTIPKSATIIGGNAFYNCSSLTSVTILSKTVEIYDNSSTFPTSATIYGYAGSTAEEYAAKYGRKFVALEEEPEFLYSGTCGAEGDNLTWGLTADGELIISGTGKMADYGYDVPWRPYKNSISALTIEDGVTSVGEQAFRLFTGFTSVTIPGSVTNIGECAFQHCALESVTFSECVTSIGRLAFDSCANLANVSLPDSVTDIGDHAFGHCSNFTSVTIPEGVTNIGAGVFYWCENLVSITVDENNGVYYSENNCVIERANKKLVGACNNSIIPDDVTSIGASAFGGCQALTSVVIPEGVTSIEAWAFDWCKSLTSLNIPDSVTSISEYAFASCQGLTSVTIGKGVENIGDFAFCYCLSLERVTIPDSVTSIGDGAFCFCNSLTDVTIGEGVTSIGGGAFNDCPALENVIILSKTVEIYDDSYTISGTAVIYGYAGSTAEAYALKYGRTFVALEEEPEFLYSGTCGAEGDNVTWGLTEDGELIISGKGEMADYTNTANVPWKSYGKSITKATIGAGVTSIDNLVFFDCTNIALFTVAEGNSVFYSRDNCIIEKGSQKLVFGCGSSVIPNGVKIIGEGSFWRCQELRGLTIPASVTRIEKRAFRNCPNFVSLTVAEGNSVYYSENNCVIEKASKTLVVGCGNVVIPEGVTSIGASAFYDCVTLMSVNIPASVTSIDASAFSRCSRLTSITVNEGNRVYYSENNCIVETASKKLVVGCRASEIPSDVLTIGVYAFEGCAGIGDVTIPDSVETIELDAFWNSGGLTGVVINGATKINGTAFAQCYSLKNVSLGERVKSIGYDAFRGCTRLESITILSKNVEIYDSEDTIYESATIYGYAGSTAEAYAIKYGKKFVAID